MILCTAVKQKGRLSRKVVPLSRKMGDSLYSCDAEGEIEQKGGTAEQEKG